MKLGDIPYLLGFKPTPKTYSFECVTFELPKDGTVRYAQWLHPKETRKIISQESVDELRKFLAPGDVAIDIGAHTGDSTIPIALAVGTTGCVLALEPNPYVFPVLRENSLANPDRTNIVPLMFAATPEEGDYEFEYSDPGFCNGGRHEGISRWRHGHAFRLPVRGNNLESFLRHEHDDLVPRIRFIKVDTEGYDYTILTTLSGLISTQKPYIMTEVFKWMPREQRVAFYRFLAGHGYAVYRVESSSNYRGEQIDETQMMNWRHFDVFCVPAPHY